MTSTRGPRNGDDTYDLIDDGATWHDIATALATSPEQAELTYNPDSPVADSRWPHDY